jgi:hypothetical protein
LSDILHNTASTCVNNLHPSFMQIIDQHRIKARPTAVNFASSSLSEINLSQFHAPVKFANCPSTRIDSEKFANIFEVREPSPFAVPVRNPSKSPSSYSSSSILQYANHPQLVPPQGIAMSDVFTKSSNSAHFLAQHLLMIICSSMYHPSKIVRECGNTNNIVCPTLYLYVPSTASNKSAQLSDHKET